MNTLMALALVVGALFGTAPAPSASLYDVPLDLTDTAGRPFELRSLEGRPVLVTMFYASCGHTCPLIVADLRRIEGALDPARREALQVVLVSLDPERDTPERLRATRDAYGVDAGRWHLLRAAPEDVRTLAAILGVKYRGMPDGQIGHDAVIALLDPRGEIARRLTGLRQPADEVLAHVRAWVAP